MTSGKLTFRVVARQAPLTNLLGKLRGCQAGRPGRYRRWLAGMPTAGASGWGERQGGTGQGAPRSLSGRHFSGCDAGCRHRPAPVPPVHSSPRARPARRVPSWTAWAGRAAWRSRRGVEGRFPSVGSGAAFAPVADQAVAVDVPAGDVSYAVRPHSPRGGRRRGRARNRVSSSALAFKHSIGPGPGREVSVPGVRQHPVCSRPIATSTTARRSAKCERSAASATEATGACPGVVNSASI